MTALHFGLEICTLNCTLKLPFCTLKLQICTLGCRGDPCGRPPCPYACRGVSGEDKPSPLQGSHLQRSPHSSLFTLHSLCFSSCEVALLEEVVGDPGAGEVEAVEHLDAPEQLIVLLIPVPYPQELKV